LRVGGLVVVEVEREEFVLVVVGADCLIESCDEVEAEFDGVSGELILRESFI
jgi:hypothetical protein